MAPTLIAKTTAAAGDALSASRRRALSAAVDQFVDCLRRIPDGSPKDLEPGDLATVRTLAEDVIAKIEGDLEKDDSGGAAKDLAEDIYDIRAALEELDRWQRHYS
jgi:hypothetical protein